MGSDVDRNRSEAWAQQVSELTETCSERLLSIAEFEKRLLDLVNSSDGIVSGLQFALDRADPHTNVVLGKAGGRRPH